MDWSFVCPFIFLSLIIINNLVIIIILLNIIKKKWIKCQIIIKIYPKINLHCLARPPPKALVFALQCPYFCRPWFNLINDHSIDGKQYSSWTSSLVQNILTIFLILFFLPFLITIKFFKKDRITSINNTAFWLKLYFQSQLLVHTHAHTHAFTNLLANLNLNCEKKNFPFVLE